MKLDKAEEMLEEQKANGVHLLGGVREMSNGTFHAVIDGQFWHEGKLMKSDHFENQRDFATYDEAKASMAEAIDKLRKKYEDSGTEINDVPIQ